MGKFLKGFYIEDLNIWLLVIYVQIYKKILVCECMLSLTLTSDPDLTLKPISVL